jgi:hypothetical protein
MRRALVSLAAFALTACGGPERAPAPYNAFLPTVIRQGIPGRIPWETRIELTNPNPGTMDVAVHRCPGEKGREETGTIRAAPGTTVFVPERLPALPCVSTFLLESPSPFSVRAFVEKHGGGGPPPMPVPVIPEAGLVRPGDRLLVGPFVDDSTERSHFCFGFPATSLAASPVEVRIVFFSPDGKRLGERLQLLFGIPTLVEDPWQKYALPRGAPFRLDATFLGSSGWKRPGARLWIYGITTTRATSASRFLQTVVVRRRQ